MKPSRTTTLLLIFVLALGALGAVEIDPQKYL